MFKLPKPWLKHNNSVDELSFYFGHSTTFAPGNASDLPDPFTDLLPDDNVKRSNSKQPRQGMNARAASGFRQAC